MRHVFLAIVLIVAAAGAAWSQPATARVTLLQAAEVQPAKPVALREIATIAASADVTRRLGAIVVSTGPTPGEQRAVQASYVRAAIGSANVSTPVRVTGAEKVVLTGKCARWPSADLIAQAKSFLTEVLPHANRTYEISVARAPRDLTTAAGESTEVKARLLNSTVRLGSNTVALEAFVDGTRAATASVTLDVRAVAEILVATAPIRQGETLGPQNTAWDRRDVTRMTGAIEPGAGQSVPEYIARRTIQPGTAITETDVTTPPMVRKGDAVSLVVTCGNVKLTSPAEARQDGKAGDVIRVNCTATGQDVRGKVIEPGLVEVTP